MTKLFCDKCGQEIKQSRLQNEIVLHESGENFTHKRDSLSVYMSWNYRNAKGLEVKNPDICVDCTRKYLIETMKTWGIL